MLNMCILCILHMQRYIATEPHANSAPRLTKYFLFIYKIYANYVQVLPKAIYFLCAFFIAARHIFIFHFYFILFFSARLYLLEHIIQRLYHIVLAVDFGGFYIMRTMLSIKVHTYIIISYIIVSYNIMFIVFVCMGLGMHFDMHINKIICTYIA